MRHSLVCNILTDTRLHNHRAPIYRTAMSVIASYMLLLLLYYAATVVAVAIADDGNDDDDDDDDRIIIKYSLYCIE